MVAFDLAIAQAPFWLTAFFAVLALNAITQAGIRKAVWAALNLGFLTFLIREQILFVLVGLAIFGLTLRLLASTRLRWTLIVPVSALVLLLFLINKLEILFFHEYFAPARQILVAVGFSYVSLRMIDVLRSVSEKRHPPPDVVSLVNYLLPFHMLAAGPIQAFDEFVKQPPVPEPLRHLSVLKAVERIAFGLFKKFVLATFIAEIFLNDFWEVGPYMLIEVQFFFLWLYLDFSAYTDIAVGLGRLMGVATPENFNRPYFARNMIDFWERWHISLSLFIRRHIYIPIFASLTRRSPDSDPLALSATAFIVAFLLCGLWHGINVNFFLWGAAHAFGLVVTNVYHHELRRRLSTRQWKAYLANPVIRCIAVVLTYEFVAFSLLALFFPR